MKHLLEHLIVYSSLKNDPVIAAIAAADAAVKEHLADSKAAFARDALISSVYDQVHHIMETATTYGFERNLWQGYITFLIMTDENPLALVSEKKEPQEGSAAEVALLDCRVIR